ncbi:MAG: aspartyl-tRNA synthetase [Thermoleophilaceae bacterium]|nr:aspartyl-tRNA synthetase [Thermoleophilaceae bacterium]
MIAPRANRYRTAWAGDLRAGDVGSDVRVAGWVHRRRDHGGLIFIDLRDRSGLLQLVFHPDKAPEAHAAAHALRGEDVISVAGVLVRREEGNVNPNLPTGEIELGVGQLEVLADAETPPFQVDDEGDVEEVTRLRYRYLDLRRERMQRSIALRHAVAQAIRAHLNAADFLEIETPMLTRSTPEGARDFIVPSRLQRGSWYALPQSPQLFKQLYMVGGLERYYQIVRCFRDEDLRADRQPEFTQLDIEMSFVEEDDVMEMVDALLQSVLAVAGIEIELPLDRISYDDAMLRYGSDKPDRRPGMEIHDLGHAFAGSEFKVFAGALAGDGVVRGLRTGGEFPRSRLDQLTEQAKALGAKGLVWATIEAGGEWRSPIAKFLKPEEMGGAAQALGASEGDTIFAVADSSEVAARVLGTIRLELAGPQQGHDLFWVVDFPMFERDEVGGLTPLHHPFTSPAGDLSADPIAWRSRAYDVVMDGWELGGGSIRISRTDVQERVFEVLGLSPEQARERFGFLLEAFRYGAPPHGGIAFGFDRIVALLGGHDNIREVIPFPKTASGVDPLTGAPAPADPEQLRELGISVQAPPRVP